MEISWRAYSQSSSTVEDCYRIFSHQVSFCEVVPGTLRLHLGLIVLWVTRPIISVLEGGP